MALLIAFARIWLASLGVATAHAQIAQFPPDMTAVRAALADMPALAAPAAMPAGLPLEATSIWDEPPVTGIDSPEAIEYAGLAERLAAQNPDFSFVFSGLCRHLLDNARVQAHPKEELRNLYRGLIRWTRNGGKPSLQGRADWALHFLYGGYLAASYGYGVAETAAYAKEVRDANSAGNCFDLDDMAVTWLGARWAASAEAQGGQGAEAFLSGGPRRGPGL